MPAIDYHLTQIGYEQLPKMVMTSSEVPIHTELLLHGTSTERAFLRETVKKQMHSYALTCVTQSEDPAYKLHRS